MDVRQSTARTIVIGPILDADGAAKTDEVVASIKIHKNGAAAAALNGSATLTHSQGGFYLLAMTTSDTDTAGVAEFSLDSTTNTMPVKAINVLTQPAWDALYAESGGALPADAVKVSGNQATADRLELMMTGSIAYGTVNAVTDDGDFTLTSTDLSTNDGDYAKMWLLFLDGNNKFVLRRITTYTGATKQVQFTGGGDLEGAFPRTVQAGDKFFILAG